MTIPNKSNAPSYFTDDARDAPLYLCPREAKAIFDSEANYALPVRLDLIGLLRKGLLTYVVSVKETDDFKALADRLEKHHTEELGLQIETPVLPVFPNFTKELYDVQKRMVVFCLRNRYVLLAGEAGLGKTLCATYAAALMLQKEMVKRWLILCPATATISPWEPELTEAGLIFTHVRKEPNYLTSRAFTLVTPDQLLVHLRSDPKLLKSLVGHFDGIISDDLEELSNPKTLTYQVMQELREGAAAWIDLNGTPIINRLSEAYWRVDLIQPGLLGAWEPFRLRNRIMDVRSPSHSTRQRFLQSELATVVFAASLSDIGKELPPLIERDIIVPLSTEQQKLYNMVHEQGRFTGEDQNRLKLYSKAQQIADDIGLLLNPYQAAASSKRDELERLLPRITAGESKVMIYTQSRKWLYGLAGYFHDYYGQIIAGDRSLTQRREALQVFAKDPACKILWVTDAAQRAITVHEANTVVTLNLPWSSNLYQTIARIRRGDDAEQKTWIRLLADCDLERKKWDLIRKKKALLNSAVMDIPELIKAGLLTYRELYV